MVREVHKIDNADEILNFVRSQEILVAGGGDRNGNRKRMLAYPGQGPWYVVKTKADIHYGGPSLATAITTYNNL